MRITGGRWCGRKLHVPDGILRPTQDRVREAVFSSLGDYTLNACVLDLFAGSGAYGLEALSRGARNCRWVEKHPQAVRSIERNIRTLLCGPENTGITVRPTDVYAFLRHPATDPANLIFADPPYDQTASAENGERLLEALSASSSIACDAVLIYEQNAKVNLPNNPNWECLRNKTYGKTRILIYRHRQDIPRQRGRSG